MDHLELTYGKLNVGQINDLVKDKSCGAISLFLGTTRNNFENKEVITLEYEAYEAMAMKELKAICKELRAQWTELEHIAIHHRLGRVPVLEESIVIAISSPHRKASLEAVAHAIEQLKKRVPIWKKEQYKNSESAWKENKECTWSQTSNTEKIKRKRARFDASLLTNIEADDISDDLVQITVDDKEMQRRMQCFITQKRREIDYNNIVDYTNHSAARRNDEEEVSTCARTDSIIVKQENSNCHLRARVVKNHTGPQTNSTGYKDALDKLMQQNIKLDKLATNNVGEINQHYIDRYNAQNERIQNLEEHLGLSANKHNNITARIKALEDKVLFLESISPEYKHFLTEKPEPNNLQQIENNNYATNVVEANQFSYDQEHLDAIIERMEKEQEEFDKKPFGASSNASTNEDEI